MLITFVYTLIETQLIGEAATDLESWRLECDNALLKKQNEKELIKGIVYMVTSVVSAAITGIIYAVASVEDKQLIYIFPLCEKFFPELSFLLELGFRFSLMFLFCIAMISPSHFVLYGLLLFKLEANILSHYIKNINQNYEKTEQLDLKSHNVIKDRLLVCVKHHISFNRLTKRG